MYSLPSASQIREPCPRTMNGGSLSTALKARTGEFTPPGITCSARFCRRRDSSSLRDILGIFLVIDGPSQSQKLLTAEFAEDREVRREKDTRNDNNFYQHFTRDT